MIVNERIDRIDLHDSKFEVIERNSAIISIAFDWTILEDYEEEGIQEPVVLGITTMSAHGICKENIFIKKDNNQCKTSNFPDDISKKWNTISNYKIDENSKLIQLSGVYIENNKEFGITWQFNYESCRIYSDSFFTLTNWENGNLSDYLKKKLTIR
jgi:hypothetical protein